MDFLFRVDGNEKMGLGHLMRCRALAEALIGKGHRCGFAVADPDPTLSAMLGAVGIDVHGIRSDHDRGAEETLALAKMLRIDGLIVDGYHLGDFWRSQLRQARRPILAFADGPLRPDHADLLLDAATPPSGAPNHLFGPDYVLLRRELVDAAVLPPVPMAERRSVLVTFGGADPTGMTVPTVIALNRILRHVPIVAVIGGANAGRNHAVAELASLTPNVEVRVAPPRMGDLMRAAGLAVSAAGSTVGELAAVGVPMILAVVADNQEAGAAACAQAGWCTVIDARGADDAPKLLAEAAAAQWSDPWERERRAARARDTVDPFGADRAADAFIRFVADRAGETPR